MKEYFAAPGVPPGGSGTIGNPWDLATALNATGTIGPGDRLYLRAGIYSTSVTLATDNYMYRSTLAGSAGNPIIVSPYLNEQPRIDGFASAVPAGGYSTLYVEGSDVMFRDLEIFNSNPDRTQAAAGQPPQVNGVYIHSPRSKFINCILHDNPGDSFGFWEDAIGGELYGNLCFNNGVHNPTTNVYWGHGVYGQNDTGIKRIRDNIFLHQWSTGIGPHATANQINNFTIEGNVVYQNGSHVIDPINYDTSLPGTNLYNDLTSPDTVIGMKIKDNHVYYAGGLAARESLQLTQPTTSAEITGNYLIRGGINMSGTQTTPTYSGNTIVHSFLTGWTVGAYPDNTYYDATLSEAPTANVVVVRPNVYDANRAHVIIYNWENLTSVTVDISALGWLSGSVYNLHNTENYYGDIQSGIVTGPTITVDMQDANRSVATPTNWSVTPATTFPTFGAFVLINKSGVAPHRSQRLIGAT